MTWIKRNLFFLVSILVAVALIGVGGYFYLYNQYQREVLLRDDISKSFKDLADLAAKRPHPGSSRTGGTDNVTAAKEQTTNVMELAKKLRDNFKPIPVPSTSGNFSHQLDLSLGEMRATASQAGVGLPNATYAFTFQTETKMVNLPPASFPQIATYLSEIKAICDILFEAKVNSIDSISRPVIASLETNGPDFIPGETNASPQADITPFKVSFRCFSGELATVMSDLASSPHGLVVKYVDVDPGTVPTAMVTPPKPGGRPAVFLNENQFQVTMLIDIVKPKPVK